MKIKIKPSQDERQFVYIDVDRREKIESVRKIAATALGALHGTAPLPSRLSLFYRGKQLANGMELFDYDVGHGAVIISHEKAEVVETVDAKDADDGSVSSGSPKSICVDSPGHDTATVTTAAGTEATGAMDIDSGVASSTAIEGDKNGEGGVQVKCDHCDNSLDSACKHCGCFYCGKKDDEDHTLACDECGHFYHMRCLPVPLTAVPEDDWYCEFCKNDADAVISGERKLDLSNRRKAKLPSATQTKQWGGGMACAGTTKTCSIVPKDHIGPIPGVHVGQSWKYRIHVSESGIHRPPVGGIAGSSKKPAQSIVLAGGYPEDVDHGDEFVYTGSGGYDLSGNKRQAKTQTFDQELTRQNLSLALACAAKVNDKEGATAADWRASSPIRVCRSYKIAKMHPEYAPTDGVRYDGLYRIVKYWKEKGVSGFYIWRYLFRRDDPEPAPWTAEGKELIEKLGLELYNPVEDADSKKPGASKAGKKRKGAEGSESPETSKVPLRKRWFEPTPVLRELMRLDTENSRLWKTFGETQHASESAYLESLTEDHLGCPICQDLVQQPTTMPCGHNICNACLCKSMDKYGVICPVCRSDISSMGKLADVRGQTNQNLVTILRALIPSYGKDWITMPDVATTQYAQRLGPPASGL